MEKSSSEQSDEKQILPESYILNPRSCIFPLAKLGESGLGEVQLIRYENGGDPEFYVLKKMIPKNENARNNFFREFMIQIELFRHCSMRIPRPFFILDLLDPKSFDGVFGFVMEFCIGGSIRSFSKNWGARKHSGQHTTDNNNVLHPEGEEKEDEEEEDEEEEDEKEEGEKEKSKGEIEESFDVKNHYSQLDSGLNYGYFGFDPLTTLDPLRIAAICVGMIECLDDVYRANPGCVHRDIKPDNFLVRVENPGRTNEKFTIVLGDFGIVRVLDSISSEMSSKSVVKEHYCSISSEYPGTKPKEIMKITSHISDQSLYGTLAYNSHEALYGEHSQKSDAYALGMSILALFRGGDPFSSSPLLRSHYEDLPSFAKLLCRVQKIGFMPQLSFSPLFESLITIEGGMFTPIYKCLNEVYEGLTEYNVKRRMSVHKACEKVQSIKHLLPRIGEGWKCPTIDEIIENKFKQFRAPEQLPCEPIEITIDECDKIDDGRCMNPNSVESGSDYETTEVEPLNSSGKQHASSSSSSTMQHSKTASIRNENFSSYSESSISVKKPQLTLLKLKKLIQRIEETNSTESVTDLFFELLPSIQNCFMQVKRVFSAIPSREYRFPFVSQEYFTILFQCLASFILHIIPTKSPCSFPVEYRVVTLKLKHATEIMDQFFDLMVEIEEIFIELDDEQSLFDSVIPITKFLYKIVSNYQDVATLAKNPLKNDYFSRIPLVMIKNIMLIIKECPDPESKSKLYRKTHPLILNCFESFKKFPENSQDKEFQMQRNLMRHCFRCLRWFVRHEIPGNTIYLPIPDMNHLVSTFMNHLSNVEKVLQGDVDEDYCDICMNFTFNTYTIHDKWTQEVTTYHDFLQKISPTFVNILQPFKRQEKKGDQEYHCLEDIPSSTYLRLFYTLRNIAGTSLKSTKQTIFYSFVRPFAQQWLKYFANHLNDEIEEKCFEQWIKIFIHLTWSSEDDAPFGSICDADSWPIFSEFEELVKIFASITWSNEDNIPNKSICSEIWDLFHPVLDVVKREYIGDKIVEDGYELVLLFFSNLCCDPGHALEIYDNVKDLLDGWFEVIKRNQHELGIKYWSRLISMLSTVPSLVPEISPKYDTSMEWCKEWCYINGEYSEVYSRYLGNCYPFLKKWVNLAESIEKCPDPESTSKLYREHRDGIRSVFDASKTKSTIEEVSENKKEIVLCIQCLRWFVKHWVVAHFPSKTGIYLPISDLDDLISTFLDTLSKELLKEYIDEEYYEAYCEICVNYTFKVKCQSLFFEKVSPSFECILDQGRKKKLEGNIARNILGTLRNMVIVSDTSCRNSIFTLIQPYIKDWLRIYKSSVCYGEWMYILSFITLSSDNMSPNKSLCSKAWPLFYPILDVVKKEFVGDKLFEDDHVCVLMVFSRLCHNQDQSHLIEIYDNIKDLLDGWFEKIMGKRHQWGIVYWANLISMLSTVPSIVPQISPKYDKKMRWCVVNGNKCYSSHFSRFFENSYPSLERWVGLVESINESPDSKSTSILYHTHREEILSVFSESQSESEIIEHKRAIVICIQCLDLFVMHSKFRGVPIYLPNPVLNDLIDTFIGHLSRCEEVLEGDVEEIIAETYFNICVNYVMKVPDHCDSFLPEIYSTFSRILHRERQKKFESMKISFPAISAFFQTVSLSHSLSTKTLLFELIQTYINEIFTIAIYKQQCCGVWFNILANITWSNPDNTPYEPISRNTWDLFVAMQETIKEELVSDIIVQNDNYFLLFFLSNLCLEQRVVVELYFIIGDLLEPWIRAIKTKEIGLGVFFWSRLIYSFSNVNSLVDELHPRYTEDMRWCADHQTEILHKLEHHPFLKFIMIEQEGEISTIFHDDFHKYCENCGV
ncbi:hypothetical protein ADUPG1_006656 [Aduncisulcus paluster]|uniref:Protein kinase domain-containing protein n=1 Tax=Aduncisulcus paluster TaxID=2918883 RepID=A0ABQ5KJ24_9EUKA|nr:hypothetical protein ADUPG1_006656 [Aduncisulcus paluster]